MKPDKELNTINKTTFTTGIEVHKLLNLSLKGNRTEGTAIVEMQTQKFDFQKPTIKLEKRLSWFATPQTSCHNCFLHEKI